MFVENMKMPWLCNTPELTLILMTGGQKMSLFLKKNKYRLPEANYYLKLNMPHKISKKSFTVYV
jgi:hypothetical protein